MAAPAKKPPATDKPAADGAEAAPPKKKSKLLLIIVIAVVVLAAGGAGAYFFLQGKPQQAASKAAEQKKAKDVAQPAIYVALDPPFVVNFEAQQVVRFLQITVQLLTHNTETAELLKLHDPVIRNDLLMLYGNQKYETISTREGKEALRAQSLAAVRAVIVKAGGSEEDVENVFFTSFVMQ
jgi:flagellar protein FliL